MLLSPLRAETSILEPDPNPPKLFFFFSLPPFPFFLVFGVEKPFFFLGRDVSGVFFCAHFFFFPLKVNGIHASWRVIDDNALLSGRI